MTRSDSPGVVFHPPSRDGEIKRLIRERDWRATALGATETWPRSLHCHLHMVLELPTAAIIFWGPDQIQLYNQGYAVIMGPRHPRYLGEPYRECWPETYDTVHPWMLRVLRDGETVEVNRTLVPLTRYGFTEEAYFTFTFSPLLDDEQQIAGILNIVTEVTATVLAERRASVHHELSNQIAVARTASGAVHHAMHALGTCAADLPFTVMYMVDPLDDHSFVLAGSTGIAEPRALFAPRIDIRDAAARPGPALARAVGERRPVVIDELDRDLAAAYTGPGPVPARAIALPIGAADHQRVVAVLIAGISPWLRFDDRYRDFLDVVSAQLASLVGAARAHDEARQRAEALVAIDRAKTEFFGNISHEFRTPLTLMLGPLEDALLAPAQALSGAALVAVHRNSLRLLRLVNTLLEFARVEADRVQARYEPTDLAVVTAGLAGSFRSVIESAGLSLRIDCPNDGQLAYVDRAQWERIVWNLVSNAFKFTPKGGRVEVSLKVEDGDAQIEVTDTGIGISAEFLPFVFDRFRQADSSMSRRHSGLGLGMAIVRHLVELHGGTVSVSSAGENQGTTFRLRLATHTGELPETLSAPVRSAPEAVVDAALEQLTGVHVLIVEDDTDSRNVLAVLLQRLGCLVEAVSSAREAYDRVSHRRPDVLVSDIGMPEEDGYSLIRRLRQMGDERRLPAIALTAYARKQDADEAIASGYDRHLAKPVSPSDLIQAIKAITGDQGSGTRDQGTVQAPSA